MKSTKETILIKNIEQLKQIIKDRSYNNYELMVVDNKIMIKGVKCSKPRTEPKQKPKTLKQLMLEGFDKINNRLDNVDKRLDRHDQLFEMVLDQFKKHKWI